METEKIGMEHSREDFEAGEENLKAAKSRESLNYDIAQRVGVVGPLNFEIARLRVTEAEEKLKELMISGKEEAEALNAEYDRLKNDATASLEAIHKFEVEKLGMEDKKVE